MKVIIPVAGIGSKLRPHTHTQPKVLVPVAGKAILAHIVDGLLESGLNEFIFITGYLGEKVEEFINENYPDLNKHFVLQTPRKGTGHAVWMAKDLINEGDEALIILGDTIIDFDVRKFIGTEYSMLGVKKVDDPRNFGVAELSDDGFIDKLTEKPKIPKSNLALVGIYMIKEAHKLMIALDEIIKKDMQNHGEYQLTDGIMKIVEGGVKAKTFPVSDWFDCGSKESLLATNATLLKREGHKAEMKQSYHNAIIIDPVSIAEGCTISDSIIGPNVTIGERTTIENSIVGNSIIGSFSQIRSVVLKESVIGSDTILKGMSQSLNIGDNTELDFSN